jgi:uncharacterized protein with NRDE domain
MCLLAIHYRVLTEAPILLAANREEYYDRPTLPPHVQPGAPRVLCGVDARAGGTWLGVNEHGLVVAVTNRPSPRPPGDALSRGTLCRQLLEHSRASDASEQALRELQSGRYAGANFLCADAESGFVIHGSEQPLRLALEPGLHLITNGDLDDAGDQRIQLARKLFAAATIHSAAEFVEQAGQICQRETILLRFAQRGTVSSTLMALPRDRTQSVYRYAPGPPDMTAYDDYSLPLRELLR